MSSLKARINRVEADFQKSGTVSVVSPTVGTRKTLKSNKELVNYAKAEIAAEIKDLKRAAGVIFRLESLFGRKVKGDKVVTLGGTEITRDMLTKYKQSYRASMDAVVSNLASLTRRVRRASTSTLFTGPNALTYIDNNMVNFLNGSVGDGIFATPFSQLLNNLNSTVAPKTKTVNKVQVSGRDSVNGVTAAIGQLPNIKGDNSLGQALGLLFGRDTGFPAAAVSRFVLITAPHLIKNYRKNILGQKDVEVRLPLPGGKKVRPYYKVTAEFEPIMDTIKALQNGQTGADAIRIATNPKDSGKIPPVIFEDGYYWYSLTAVQKLNSPHSAKKSLTGEEMMRVVDGSGDKTKRQINEAILGPDATNWPRLWDEIGSGASDGTKQYASAILALFKAVYEAVKF